MSTDPRLPGLFAQGAELPAAERDAWLAALRKSERALAGDVAALLLAAEGDGGMLDAAPPAAELAEETAPDVAPAVAPDDGEAPPPSRIGPYRILRELGRGGMGRVFLAEQEGDGFRRTVALKVIERGDLGAEAVRRFRDEVRILASLEHPGIARFLDGGRTSDGTWFLALEYVEGVGLLEHARARALSVDERVRLFLAVLEAVMHAHGRSVVHRDLKPANILVGDGRPKLLDFGIAKLVDPEEPSDDGTLTRTELRAFTPAYASPEQFRGERATAASDVYSLGVILYELLAGVRPYRTTSSSRVELERAVLHEDPEPPSTAARRAAAEATTEDLATDARPSERRRDRRLGKDLDAICLQALRKEPAERYPSAAALADDLHRYLAAEAVAARRGGRRYRLARLLRRHRGRLATAAALVVAAAAFAWGALRETAPAAPSAPPTPRVTRAPQPRPFPLPKEGSVPVEELQRRFAAAPASVETGAALVSALMRESRTDEAAVVIGRLRQLPGGATDPLVDYTEAVVATNLDESQRALALVTRALATAEKTGRGELLARLHAGRGRNLSDLGRRDEARAELQTSIDAARKAGDEETLARSLNDLAIEELTRGRLAEGERLLREALAWNRKLGDDRRAAAVLHNLAGLAFQRGRPDLAAARYREAAATFHRFGHPRREAIALGDLAQSLLVLGRPTEAREPLAAAIATLSELDDDTSLAYVLVYRAHAAVAAGELHSVEKDAATIEAGARASGNQTALALADGVRGRAAAARGDFAGARKWLADAHRIFDEAGETDLAAEVGLVAADVELEAGDDAAAASLAEASAKSYAGTETDTDVAFGAAVLLARVDVNAGRLDAARRRLAALPGGDKRPSVAMRLQFLAARAALARAEERRNDARRDLRTAIDVARTAERKLDELDLRLQMVDLERSGANTALVTGVARVVAEEAASRGLEGLAARARTLASGG